MLRKIVLLGDPVAHSLSPAMHDAAFRSLGLELVYETWRVARRELGDAMAALRTDAFAGANVTIPHKEEALRLADAASETARRVGAANTLVRRGERLDADNTDVLGFLEALREASVAVAGRRVLVLGAGGAARACVEGLTRSGARVEVAARRRAQADELASRWSDRDVSTADWPRDLVGRSMVVNATPLGLHGEDPLEGVPLGQDQVVFDLIPTAAETPLVRRARGAGCATIDGLVMLLYQAARSFELWTEKPAPVDVMRGALPRRVRDAVPDRG